MIVTVRRWTSIALPRLWARNESSEKQASKQNQESVQKQGFFDTYQRMFEHQINLMFKDDVTW